MRVPTPPRTPWSRIAAALFALGFLVGACGSDASDADGVSESGQAEAVAADANPVDDATPDGAENQDVETSVDASGSATSPTAVPTTPPLTDEAVATGDAGEADDAESSGESSDGLDPEQVGDRGLRSPGEERAENDGETGPSASPSDEDGTTSETETETVSVEPTATPEPTPTPLPATDPIQPPPAQLPDEPVPSDDLAIQGPPTDDGTDIPVFSNEGILACATTEAAIEFLDRRDLTRTEQALQSAAALASSAAEAELVALAPQLSSAGRNSDASFAAIVAMLSACAQYGYEV